MTKEEILLKLLHHVEFSPDPYHDLARRTNVNRIIKAIGIDQRPMSKQEFASRLAMIWEGAS